MEKIGLFDNFLVLPFLLSYYHYTDKCYKLMRSLSKTTQELLEDNLDDLIRSCSKRELQLHYPLFKSLVKPLKKNRRFQLYKLILRIKFPEDYDEFIDFIKSTKSLEFSLLELVIIEDSLVKANTIIDLLREKGIISAKMDDSYEKIICKNYCKAANMETKLRYESEMVVGAEPKAFIDKVENVGFWDVREASRCPIEDIEFEVYKIKIDKAFSNLINSGCKKLKDSFRNSVKKIVIEEEIKEMKESLPQIIQNWQATFPNVIGFELKLIGSEVTQNKSQALDIEHVESLLSELAVKKFEYEGLELDSTVQFTSSNLTFAIGEGTNIKLYKASSFVIEFEQGNYEVNGDYIFINTNHLNLKIADIEEVLESPDYSTLDVTHLSSKAYILHKKFLNVLHYKDVPEHLPQVIPNCILKLYISEREEYTHLNDYLKNYVSHSLPIHIELDIGFSDDLENTQDMIRVLFKKNVQKVDIVQDMMEDELIDVLFDEIMKSTTIREMQPILNQNCTRVINLLKDKKGIEQWILDVRRPWDEQKNDIISLVKDCKDNSFVINDHCEFLIEFRFKTSFQIKSII